MKKIFALMLTAFFVIVISPPGFSAPPDVGHGMAINIDQPAAPTVAVQATNEIGVMNYGCLQMEVSPGSYTVCGFARDWPLKSNCTYSTTQNLPESLLHKTNMRTCSNRVSDLYRTSANLKKVHFAPRDKLIQAAA